MVKVDGTAKLFPPNKDVEIEILARFADHLSPEVCAIIVNDDRLLIGLSADLEEHSTLSVAHILLSIAVSLARCREIKMDTLNFRS